MAKVYTMLDWYQERLGEAKKTKRSLTEIERYTELARSWKAGYTHAWTTLRRDNPPRSDLGPYACARYWVAASEAYEGRSDAFQNGCESAVREWLAMVWSPPGMIHMG